jgi:solute carrier family 25 (mitochondrial phosphate transporter), member 23/24/25/41
MRDRESANAQDARVEELWGTLDTTSRGYLDLKGLKKGLKKLDHRMWMHV